MQHDKPVRNPLDSSMGRFKDECRSINKTALAAWSFGLKVERCLDGFIVSKMSRASSVPVLPLFSHPFSAKETFCYLSGFRTAAEVRNTDSCRWDIEDGAELHNLYQTGCGYYREDRLLKYLDYKFCPCCGRPIILPKP